MTSTSLIPVLEAIPVNAFWPESLLILTFTAHILLMNAVFGGTFIALVQTFKGQGEIARNLSRKLPTILALTINAGVAPLLFLQTLYGNFDYPASVLMAVYWLVVIPVLLAGYYGLYWYDFRYSSLGDGKRRVVLCVITALLLYVAFMFTNNMTLMLRPEFWSEYFGRPYGLILNFGDPALFPRYLHFLAAALAIGGLSVALIGRSINDRNFIRTGMSWFVRATIVNFVIGTWFLMSLPPHIMVKFMGGDTVSTITLLSGIAASGGLIHFGVKQKVRLATVFTLITVFAMVLSRHQLRNYYLEPYFSLKQLPSTGQWTPMAMFLGFAVVGTFAVHYMVKLWLKAERS